MMTRTLTIGPEPSDNKVRANIFRVLYLTHRKKDPTADVWDMLPIAKFLEQYDSAQCHPLLAMQFCSQSERFLPFYHPKIRSKRFPISRWTPHLLEYYSNLYCGLDGGDSLFRLHNYLSILAYIYEQLLDDPRNTCCNNFQLALRNSIAQLVDEVEGEEEEKEEENGAVFYDYGAHISGLFDLTGFSHRFGNFNFYQRAKDLTPAAKNELFTLFGKTLGHDVDESNFIGFAIPHLLMYHLENVFKIGDIVKKCNGEPKRIMVNPNKADLCGPPNQAELHVPPNQAEPYVPPNQSDSGLVPEITISVPDDEAYISLDHRTPYSPNPQLDRNFPDALSPTTSLSNTRNDNDEGAPIQLLTVNDLDDSYEGFFEVGHRLGD